LIVAFHYIYRKIKGKYITTGWIYSSITVPEKQTSGETE